MVFNVFKNNKIVYCFFVLTIFSSVGLSNIVFASTDQSAPTESEVLVVYNSAYTTDSDANGTQDSQQIAEYYQSKRPGVTIQGFDMPTTEEISWNDYNTQIKTPLENYLTTHGVDTFKIIVTVKGVPLKIMGDPGHNDPWAPGCNPYCYDMNYAAVDAGISLSFQDFKTTGRHNNPYYNTDAGLLRNNHFKSNYFTANGFTLRYLVSRLDGYTLTDIKDMIDRGVGADKTGSGYFVLDKAKYKGYDLMSSANDKLLSLGKHTIFDTPPYAGFITTGSNVIGYTSYGVNTEKTIVNPPEVIPSMGDGYVSNDPINPYHLNFSLLPGAVFSTYESYNAWGFVSPAQSTQGQLGEWIKIGGSGGIGNVNEPWSSGIANENVWMPAYAIGYPWVEAAYMSIPYAGFVEIVLGDPLMTIAKLTPPAAVSNLQATAGNTLVNLTWTKPGDNDLAGVKIIRKLGSYPSNVNDGTLIYNGLATSFIDSSLTNNTDYYYAAFAYDGVPNYSVLNNDSKVLATPGDFIAPGAVSNLQATTGNTFVSLTWTNPGDSDLVGVRIIRKLGSYPNNVNDGTLIYDGLSTSFTNSSLTNNTDYYYAAFAYDGVPNYSVLNNDSKVLATPFQPSSGGPGGGGGGGGDPTPAYCTSITYSDWSSCSNSKQTRSILSSAPTSCIFTTEQTASLEKTCQVDTEPIEPIENVETNNNLNIAINSPLNILQEIDLESTKITVENFENYIVSLGKKINQLEKDDIARKYNNIISLDKKISLENKELIVDFIFYGTPSTKNLGTGERAGVINSYFQAYGKLPDSQAEWSDVLKVASGRWPSERNLIIENKAKSNFKKVYGRNADLKNNLDQNSIMIIAYGLIPDKRNFQNEKIAIKTFKWIYKKQPLNPLAWNVVRAIAYSGAHK